jgi:hypothetical protein
MNTLNSAVQAGSLNKTEKVQIDEIQDWVLPMMAEDFDPERGYDDAESVASRQPVGAGGVDSASLQ